MRLIKKLSESIENEIEGVKEYSKLAIEFRSEYPAIADLLYSLSRQESDHVQKLHESVEKLIADYRNREGEPPESMLAIYKYLHGKHIESYAEARRYQDIYAGKG